MNQRNALIPPPELPTGPGQLNQEQVELLKRTICEGATNDELALFLQVCKSKRLDPFSGQIYAIKRWDHNSRRMKTSYQTGIDGFRLIADRTGERDGEDATEWCGGDGEWKEVWLNNKPPRAARVRIYRKGHARPYTGIAQWEFYAQTKKDGGLTQMWAKGGPHMLAKCAEALALRKAFPRELSGLYTRDEMAQDEDIDVKPAEFRAPPPKDIMPPPSEPYSAYGGLEDEPDISFDEPNDNPPERNPGVLDKAIMEGRWEDAYGLCETIDDVSAVGRALDGQVHGEERDRLIPIHRSAARRCA